MKERMNKKILRQTTTYEINEEIKLRASQYGLFIMTDADLTQKRFMMAPKYEGQLLTNLFQNIKDDDIITLTFSRTITKDTTPKVNPDA